MNAKPSAGLALVAVLAIGFALTMSACCSGGRCEGVPGAAEEIVLCAKCGEEKGTDACCAPKAEKCTKCGEVKGTEKCCAPPVEKCTKCGLEKGSAQCCKVEAAKAPKEPDDCCNK